METLKVLNTEENKKHLYSTGRTYLINGKYLEVNLTAYEKAMATDKKKLKKALGF